MGFLEIVFINGTHVVAGVLFLLAFRDFIGVLLLSAGEDFLCHLYQVVLIKGQVLSGQSVA